MCVACLGMLTMLLAVGCGSQADSGAKMATVTMSSCAWKHS